MFEIRVDHAKWNRVARACEREDDGRELRRDFSAELYGALEPALGEVRTSLMSTPNGPTAHAGVPLLPAVGRELDVEPFLRGRSGGAWIVAGNTSMPRGFRHAPKRLQGRRGWKHQVFGRLPMVTQVGQPDWFDGPLRAKHARYRAAALRAADGMAKRVARSG